MKKTQQKIWTIEEWFYECTKHNLRIDLIGDFHHLKSTVVAYLLKNYSIHEDEISLKFTPANKKEQNKIKKQCPRRYQLFSNPDYDCYSLHEIRIKRLLDTKIFFDPDDNLYSLKIENYSELEYLGYSLNDADKVVAHGLYYGTELSLSFNM